MEESRQSIIYLSLYFSLLGFSSGALNKFKRFLGATVTTSGNKVVSCAFREPYMKWYSKSAYYGQTCYSIATNNNNDKIKEAFRYAQDEAPDRN